MYEFKIKQEKRVARGNLYTVEVSGKEIRILLTFHAMERIARWGLKKEDVVDTLLFPEEVLVGHRDRFIAHKRYGEHIMRCIYEYKENIPIVITVYFPYKTRFYEGGDNYADKIL